MEALLRWAAELGVSDSPSPLPPSTTSTCLGRSLIVADFPDAGGRGFAAARDLQRGELVLRVPRAALLTSDRVMADDHKIASCISAHRPRISSVQAFGSTLLVVACKEDCRILECVWFMDKDGCDGAAAARTLILCLLAEVGKGKSSSWYLYLSQLPCYYTILATFNDFEIEALHVDDAIWVAQKALCAIRSDWEEAIPVMKGLEFKPKLLMFKTWLWAFATVSSRTLHVAWDDAGCLCPIGDLFNYAAPDEDISSEEEDTKEVTKCQQKTEVNFDYSSARLTDGGYEDSEAYCLYAHKQYRKGEQVLLGYGTYTNLELLEHYGFLLNENPNEKTYIKLNLDLCTIGTWPKDSLYIHSNGHPSFALLCALRLWRTPPDRRKACSHLIYSGSLLSIENELEIMKWLGKKCVETLQQLPTTVEFDENLLNFLRKVQDSPNLIVNMDQSSFREEFAAFLRFHSVNLEYFTHNKPPVRFLRSLERWELAVRWRCSYKRSLTKCTLYCEHSVRELSLQQNEQ